MLNCSPILEYKYQVSKCLNSRLADSKAFHPKHKTRSLIRIMNFIRAMNKETIYVRKLGTKEGKTSETGRF